MTVEWFDLAQRLVSDKAGRPVPRLAYRLFRTSRSALAVRAERSGKHTKLTAAGLGSGELTGRDGDGLAMLARLGATLLVDNPPQLLVDDPRTLPMLEQLARHHAADADPMIASAAAVCGWWAERADHPGTSVVIDLVAASRATFVLGTAPSDERSPETWRRWLNITDSSCVGMHEWAVKVGGHQILPLLDEVREDDQFSFAAAKKFAAAGGDWSRPDGQLRAALGLRSRCDSADLWAAALLADPLWRQRAVFTGDVTTGVIEVGGGTARGRARTAVIVCDRPDSRLRPGTAVLGWAGPIETMPNPKGRFTGEIRSTAMRDGRLVLEVSSFRAATWPDSGARVCVLPAPPDPRTLGRSRGRYAEHYRRRRWQPRPRRREVPLDVLIAGADDD